MPGNKTVLIHPPFCMPDKPYISTAVLYSFLASQQVDVAVFDMNIEFYREYLSPANIKQGLLFGEERFQELDGGDTLNSLEMQEYLKLVHLKRRLQSPGPEPPFHLLFQDGKLTNTEQFLLFYLALDVVNTLHFPESLEFLLNTGYIRYRHSGSNFSSETIVDSIKTKSLYSVAITRILEKYFSENKADIIGISISFPDQVLPAFFATSVIKKLNPDCHIVLGGTYISSHMREVQNQSLFDWIDTLICDEGEQPLLELIRCVQERKSYDHIPGISFRQDREVITKESTDLQNSELPMPGYDCLDLSRYLVNSKSMALLVRLSQGCYWHRCTFCRTHLSFVKNYIGIETAQITSWIKQTVEHTPVRLLHFTDDAADPDQLGELSSYLIQNEIQISWIANMRLDRRINRQKLTLYQKGGCRAIYFGLESCNTRILKKMKKGISVEGAVNILTQCAAAEIPVHLYMIVGFPTETESEARDSFRVVYDWKRRGLVRQVVYNVFEISGWSDIALNKGQFAITQSLNDPNLDLSPPVTDFTCTGMNRKSARSLCFEFIRQLNDIDSLTRKEMMSVYSGDNQIRSNDEVTTQYQIELLESRIEELFALHKEKEARFIPIPSFTFKK